MNNGSTNKADYDLFGRIEERLSDECCDIIHCTCCGASIISGRYYEIDEMILCEDCIDSAERYIW